MHLVSFSVKNYRSIMDAYKLQLGEYTVLVGPNNAGKSNVLNALAVSLEWIKESDVRRRAWSFRVQRGRTDRTTYQWERDYPLQRQERTPGGRSLFTLEFVLDEEERQAFREEVGVQLTTPLKIRLGFGKEDVSVDILMKGRAKKSFNKRKAQILGFVRENLAIEYISAIRPSERALEVVRGIVAEELRQLETQDEYRKLLGAIQALQQPVLDRIAERIQATVSRFVPAVKRVVISNEEIVRTVRRSFAVEVDDGVRTRLGLKGDGVVSLVTMALIRHVSEERQGHRLLILAIEEPESHLHPGAIHGLRQVLKDIAKRQQVIVSTHSPVLVERERVGRNIIVDGGRAVRARSLDDVRAALGVQASDALAGAYLVLLVEGERDVGLMRNVLSLRSPRLGRALERGVMVIKGIGGARSLRHVANMYRDWVCNVHAFLDGDREGRGAVEMALGAGVIEERDYHLCRCDGLLESEVEDLVDEKAYREAVVREFGVDVCRRGRGLSRKKWSERIRGIFERQGKIWDSGVEGRVKVLVRQGLRDGGMDAIAGRGQEVVGLLVHALEEKLAAISA